MTLRFSVLASGSTGNATIVQTGEATVLIDAGLSAKKIEQLLNERQVQAKEIDAILVTHEHSDHIKGLGALARKYDLPIYANENTWEQLNRQIGEIAEEKKVVMETGAVVNFGSLQVESYGISHDAAEPVGYCFYQNEQKLSVTTDLGYVSERIKEKIKDSDAYVFESNHDVEMLRVGRYPWNVKRRILGDKGHLSNETAAEALCDVMTSRTKRVYLAHLSRDHNMIDLARLSVGQILTERGYELGSKEGQVELKDTYHDKSTHWDRLGE